MHAPMSLGDAGNDAGLFCCLIISAISSGPHFLDVLKFHIVSNNGFCGPWPKRHFELAAGTRGSPGSIACLAAPQTRSTRPKYTSTDPSASPCGPALSSDARDAGVFPEQRSLRQPALERRWLSWPSSSRDAGASIVRCRVRSSTGSVMTTDPMLPRPTHPAARPAREWSRTDGGSGAAVLHLRTGAAVERQP